MNRPKMTVLPESALVPARNLVHPPPDQFTHEARREQPYYDDLPREGSPPDGTFPAGTKLVLLAHDGGSMCQVVDGRGLRALTSFNGLRRLADPE